MHLSVKLRAGIVPNINDNFEKCLMKIYTPNTLWKDWGRAIKTYNIQGKYNTTARYAILVFSKRDWDFLEPLNTQP